ncbi:DUF3168 domain-containing protein [Acuticoccus mangrovi]|uniref:DUF3168 domain-containing protein n=1 Tax=Acuticoccus mangrovi TaxID=2796142 RepID=A0A934MFD9_9HYPH|nr:DUF3168 domain-containing protein [Acuticoccus mangrovi]MBJ3774820.1 DUF3168 domain-containing protein [Acuticoccus mangrovi]
MSEARHALLEAVYGALTGDAALDALLSGVFDEVPRGADYPFVAFGEMASRALDGDAAGTVEHRFEILVHSRAAGRREASDIAERVVGLLDGAALTLDGHRLDGLAHRETSVRASRDRRAYVARLRFRALTEAI